MNLLQNLQNVLNQGLSGLGGGQGLNNDTLSKLMGPAALGGLAGMLLSSKGARGGAAGALLAGGGSMLWNKWKERMQEANNGQSVAASPSAAPDQSAVRMVRAMVFAAKSDGHIDDREKQAIQSKLHGLNLGSEGEALVKQAMNEPLDPQLIAKGVASEEEALALYSMSCAVIDADHFMERSYLDALGDALNIPKDVRSEIQAKLQTGAP